MNLNTLLVKERLIGEEGWFDPHILIRDMHELQRKHNVLVVLFENYVNSERKVVAKKRIKK